MFLANRMRAAAGNRGEIPTDGLVAWYTMDNISGSTLVDEMGNYNGTINGSPTQVSGLIGQALSFDSTGDYVAIGNGFFSASPGVLISMKIKADSIIFTSGGSGPILASFATGGASSTGYDTWVQFRDDTSPVIRVGFRNDSGTREFFDTPLSFQDNNWHTVMAFFDGSNIFLSFDDIEYTGPALSGTITNNSGNSVLGIELGLNASANYLDIMDQVRIYNTLPDRDERALIANEGF